MFTILVTQTGLQSLEVTHVESKPTGIQLPGSNQKLEYGAERLPAINGQLTDLVVLRFPDVRIFNRCSTE